MKKLSNRRTIQSYAAIIITILSIERIAASESESVEEEEQENLSPPPQAPRHPGHNEPPTFKEVLKKYKENKQRLKEEVDKLGPVLEDIADDDSCLSVFEQDGDCPEETTSTPKMRDICYAECKMKGWLPDRHIYDMRELIVNNVNSYCRTVNTVMDKIFMQGPMAVTKKFQSYEVYQYLMGIDNFGYSNEERIQVIANGINSALINHVITPYSPLRPMFLQLKEKLDKHNSNKTFGVEINTHCDILTKFDALDVYTEALMKDTAMEATLLPGYFLASTVSRYLRSAVSFRLKAGMEIVRYLTGSIAGFGCQQFGGEIGKMHPIIPPPPPIDSSEAPILCQGSGSSENENCDNNARDMEQNGALNDNSTDNSRIHNPLPFIGLCDEIGEEFTLGFPVPPIIWSGRHYSGISGLNC